jgi:hypothetical protein
MRFSLACIAAVAAFLDASRAAPVPGGWHPVVVYSSNDQHAANIVGNIAQVQGNSQSVGWGGSAFQFAPATAASIGNTGVNVQSNQVYAREPAFVLSQNDQDAFNGVGNIVQLQGNKQTVKGGWSKGIQIDPATAISAHNTGANVQLNSVYAREAEPEPAFVWSSNKQDATNIVGNIAQVQANKQTVGGWGWGGKAVQIDPATAASYNNLGLNIQSNSVSARDAEPEPAFVWSTNDQDATNVVGNIVQVQANKQKVGGWGGKAVQIDPATAISAHNLGLNIQSNSVSARDAEPEPWKPTFVWSTNDQDATNVVGNIVQIQGNKQTVGSGSAFQFAPATAISSGNTGVNFQSNSVYARGGGSTSSWNNQDATNIVGNIYQSQSNTQTGGKLAAIQVNPQIAVSAGNLGLNVQQNQVQGGGSGSVKSGSSQSATNVVGNIYQSQHNTQNAGGSLVAVQANPQIAISAGNIGANLQSNSVAA